VSFRVSVFGQKGSCAEENWMGKDSFALHKGLEAIASSLSLLSETLGTAIEVYL
jgi:hypothetical protein